MLVLLHTVSSHLTNGALDGGNEGKLAFYISTANGSEIQRSAYRRDPKKYTTSKKSL